MPKGKIIESIIQKAVELGARRIVPLLTERVVTQLDAGDAADKREKWQQVAIEAIKQCGAAWLPKIEAPTTIEQFLAPHRSGGRQTAGIVEEKKSTASSESRYANDLICHSSARCKRNAAIRANVSRNFRPSTDACRKASAFGSARKAISRWTN